jgi:hypothetical protein
MTLGCRLGGAFNSLPVCDARYSRRDVLLRRRIADSLRHRGRAGSHRAALADAQPAMIPVGRSQVVRHRILIPVYGGSNPPAPASFLNGLVA